MQAASSTSQTTRPCATISQIARCFPIFLLFFLTTTPSRTTRFLFPIPIQYHAITTTPSHNLTLTTTPHLHRASIPPGASLHLTLSAPPLLTSRRLLIEAWHHPPPFRHQHPRPLLLAAHRPPPPVFDNYTAAAAAVHADLEAFWTDRSYAFLILPNATHLWHLRLLYYNATYPSTQNPTYPTLLNATLRLSLAESPHQNPCPRGPHLPQCSDRGPCIAGHCSCPPRFQGRFCETKVSPLPTGHVLHPSEKLTVYYYDVPRTGSVLVSLHSKSAANSTSLPVLIAKRLGENGGNKLAVGPPLPSTYDWRFMDREAVLAKQALQTVLTQGMRLGERLYIAVYIFNAICFLHQNCSSSTPNVLPLASPVSFRLEAYPCLEPGTIEANVRACSLSSRLPYYSWDPSVTYLLLPLLLGSITLLTMLVCVTVWAGVFRQHVFDIVHAHTPDTLHPPRDSLSDAEVNAMFPIFLFVKRETAALGATGDICCSVCLSSFEENDQLRRLACGHSYHSHCLDRWLVTNATCPRCRKSARIHADSARTLCFLVRQCLRGVVTRVQRVGAWGRDGRASDNVVVVPLMMEGG